MNEKTRISPTADPLADIDPAQRQGFDQQKIENAIREIIIAIGEDPDRDGLQDTPARVARAYKEMFSGLYQRPEEVLATTFDLNHNELVIVKNIDIFSVCEHHLLPFVGKASVGYIPNNNGQITGLSKLARLIDVYANRPAWTGSNKRKPSKKGPVKAPVRLVKPEDTKASLEHPTEPVKSGEAVANEVKKPKK